MSISLVKGQKIDLTKGNPNLFKLRVGLGWDSATKSSLKNVEKGGRKILSSIGDVLSGRTSIGRAIDDVIDTTSNTARTATNTSSIDLDASVLMLENDRYKSKVYYGNLRSSCGSVKHSGDNLTGDGEGDDETIYVDLTQVPQSINKLVFVVNIFNCSSKHQDFGMINNAYIRILDDKVSKELCRYNLTEDYSGKTALVVGELYRHNGEWKFNAVGEGTNDSSLEGLTRRY